MPLFWAKDRILSPPTFLWGTMITLSLERLRGKREAENGFCLYAPTLFAV